MLPIDIKDDAILAVNKKKYFVYAIVEEAAYDKSIADKNTDIEVKIGWTGNLKERLSDLQCGNPRSLKVIGVIECASESKAAYLEQDLHSKFDEFGIIEDREWFLLSLSAIEEVFSSEKQILINNKNKTKLTYTNLDGETLDILEDVFKYRPVCYMHPNKHAQSMRSIKKEYALGQKGGNPYRMVNWNGISVYACSECHEKDMEIKRLIKKKQQENKKNSLFSLLE